MTGILRDSWPLCERLIHRHHVFYNGSSPRRLAGLGITKFYLDRYTFVSASDGRAVVSYRYTAYHSLVCGADPGGDLFKLRVRSGKRFVVRGISRSGAESQILCTVNRPAK